tara:strand:+ start:381 stop:746 length:366 start_codon:yes stop_codon:yes gene_type:complete
MSKISEMRVKWEEAGKEEEFDRRLGLMADVVMRQTTFTREEAVLALEKNKFSIEKAILSQSDTVELKVKPTKSLNQNLFSEFRSFLDDAARTHSSRVERQRAQARQQTSSKHQKPAASSES